MAWPGVKHVKNSDFGPVIEKALTMPGFDSDEEKGSVMVGFARNTVLGVADKVIAGVKSGGYFTEVMYNSKTNSPDIYVD